MPADIIERLRHASTSTTKAKLCAEAAAEIAYLRQQLAEARERNLFANERADNLEADVMKARALALEEAAREAETSPVYFEGRDIAASIRALSAGKEG